MDVPSLLKSKIECLTRLEDLTAKFMEQVISGNFDGLEEFQQKREIFLKTLDLIDRKSLEAIKSLKPEERDEDLIKVAEETEKQKNLIITRILNFDEKVIELIENEVTSLKDELTESRKTQKNLSRFKSTWNPESGKEIDQEL